MENYLATFDSQQLATLDAEDAALNDWKPQQLLTWLNKLQCTQFSLQHTNLTTNVVF